MLSTVGSTVPHGGKKEKRVCAQLQYSVYGTPYLVVVNSGSALNSLSIALLLGSFLSSFPRSLYLIELLWRDSCCKK